MCGQLCKESFALVDPVRVKRTVRARSTPYRTWGLDARLVRSSAPTFDRLSASSNTHYGTPCDHRLISVRGHRLNCMTRHHSWTWIGPSLVAGNDGEPHLI